MPIFDYTAVDSKGRSVDGSIEAPDQQAVIRDLRNIRYTVTNIRERTDILKFAKDFGKYFERVDLYALLSLPDSSPYCSIPAFPPSEAWTAWDVRL